MAEKRVAKEWKLNPSIKVESFDLNEVNSINLINQLLKLKQSDITYSFMMNIFGSFDGKVLCHPYDIFEVPAKAFEFFDIKKNKMVSNINPFKTTIGCWVFNVFLLRDFGFSSIFGGYVNQTVNGDLFDDINQKLLYALLEEKIDVERYRKFANYTQFLMPFETILAPNHSEVMLTCTKKIEKRKQELLKQYKEDIEKGDAVVAEKIEKELLDYARELLGDDPALDNYESGGGGSFDNNFKNMYVMKGAIRDPNPNAKQEFNIATSNFIDGVSADEYSLIANSLSAGPYSRGKKTQLGGYWEKLFEAAFQTVQMGEPGSDCGTKRTIEVELTKKNLKQYIYNFIVKSNGELEELTSDNMDKYIGKKVRMRFSIFCEDKNCICNKCLGNFYYRRNTPSIGLASAQIPSTLKNASMKSFHSSNVKTTEVDPMRAFNLK